MVWFGQQRNSVSGDDTIAIIVPTQKMLAGRGSSKRAIRIDEDKCIMTVAGKPVLGVSAKDNELNMSWLSDE